MHINACIDELIESSPLYFEFVFPATGFSSRTRNYCGNLCEN